MVGIKDCAPQVFAIWMSSVVVNINDQLIANPLGMISVANEFQFDYEGMRRKKKIHPRAGTCIARRKLLRPDVGNPWS
jgi:hypothetical protein